MKLTARQVKNFWDKVDVRGSDECWPWIGSCNSKGRGHLMVNYKMYNAARIAYIIAYVTVPEGMSVCHSDRCTSANCVNPYHLRLGTHRDNWLDWVRSGGQLTGGMNVLSPEEVLDIRAWYAGGDWTYQMLADEFGVHKHTIGSIIRRKSWKHL